MIDLDAIEQAARAAGTWQNTPATDEETLAALKFYEEARTAIPVLVARLRAAEAALRTIHEFCDDGDWEHGVDGDDHGSWYTCEGRYIIEAMSADALIALTPPA